jgi:predicted metalloprotease
MDWTPGGLSSDVEDRRGSSGGGFGGGGGGLGIIGFIFLIIISLVTGRNYIGSYLAGGGTVATQAPRSMPSTANRPYSGAPGQDRPAELVSWTLDDVQRTWANLLPEQTGRAYERAKLVLYNDYTYSGCGTAQSQTGPFYCPADEKVYIDLSFWNELQRLGGSNADFAQAYVVAHELGHHVQNLLGIEQHRCDAYPVKIRHRETLCPLIWSCRPIVSLACGPTAQNDAISFTIQTSPRVCRLPQPLAMIICSEWNVEQ